jgi:hypothetical protein
MWAKIFFLISFLSLNSAFAADLCAPQFDPEDSLDPNRPFEIRDYLPLFKNASDPDATYLGRFPMEEVQRRLYQTMVSPDELRELIPYLLGSELRLLKERAEHTLYRYDYRQTLLALCDHALKHPEEESLATGIGILFDSRVIAENKTNFLAEKYKGRTLPEYLLEISYVKNQTFKNWALRELAPFAIRIPEAKMRLQQVIAELEGDLQVDAKVSEEKAIESRRTLGSIFRGRN